MCPGGRRSPLNAGQKLCTQKRPEPVSLPALKPRVEELAYIDCTPGETGAGGGQMRRKFLFTEVLQSIKGRINVRISPSGSPNEGRDQSWPMASHQAHMLRILTLETLYRLPEHFNANRQTSKILWVWFQTTAINRAMQFLWFPGAHASYVHTIP